MHQKIISLWFKIWIFIFGLFKTTKTQSLPQEAPVNYDRNEILSFISTLRAFGSQAAYKQLVDAAQLNFKPMTTQDWVNLFQKVDVDIRRGSPGHDFGHTRRDALDAFALATDKNVQTYQPAEIQAGIIALLHDFGVSFVARYRDAEWLAGHAESGAYFVYQLLHGQIEENLLLLTCYAIASHTHYLDPLPCKDGSIREPWWYELFEIDGKKYGWAVLACRFADRLDTNGSTLLLRHLLANSDALETGGKDLSGKDFYEINHNSIKIMVTPQKAMFDLPGGKKAPTTIQHVFNFANSNFGNTPYSRDDYLFPTMTRLMGYKVAQSMSLATLVKPASRSDALKVKFGLIDPIGRLEHLLYRTSRSPRFDVAWDVLNTAFSKLTAEELAVWANLIEYLDQSYDLWLEVLKSHIVENTNDFTNPVLPLLDGIIAEIS